MRGCIPAPEWRLSRHAGHGSLRGNLHARPGPARRSHRGNKARARRQTSAGGSGRVGAAGSPLGRARWPGQRFSATRAPACRGTFRGTAKARAPRPGAGRGADKAGRRGAGLPARRARAGERHGRAGLSARVRIAAAQPGTAAGPPALPQGRACRGSRLPLERSSAPSSTSRSCGGAGRRQPPPRRLMVAAPRPRARAARSDVAGSSSAEHPGTIAARSLRSRGNSGAGGSLSAPPAQARPRRRSPVGAAPAPLPPAPRHFANFRRGRGGPAAEAPRGDASPFPIPSGRRPSARRDPWGRPDAPDLLSPCPPGTAPSPWTGKPFLKTAPVLGVVGVGSPCPNSRSIAKEHLNLLRALGCLPQGCPVSSGPSALLPLPD